VPEKREELTTEGGLDVVKHFTDVKKAVEQMSAAGIIVSLFIDADKKQIEASKEIGAPVIEIHTGHYADAANLTEQTHEFEKIKNTAIYAHSLGLQVNAGHGLHYHNTLAIAMLPEVVELNIGHAIMARAFFTGLGQAVKDMKQILLSAQ